jgi:hypothetical protein
MFLAVLVGPTQTTQAALVDNGPGPQLLIGSDDDRQDVLAIQAGAAANQSLNRTDVILGGPGNDVILGLNGSDVTDGGPGQDIILGGPDAGPAPGGPPNSDVMSGGPGNDVNLWAPEARPSSADPVRMRSSSARRIVRRLRNHKPACDCRGCRPAFPGFPRVFPPRTSAA